MERKLNNKLNKWLIWIINQLRTKKWAKKVKNINFYFKKINLNLFLNLMIVMLINICFQFNMRVRKFLTTMTNPQRKDLLLMIQLRLI